MTEQVVKDAKAKRDAAQADLDKAVKDTKDEIQKAADAVKDAAPDKAVTVVDPAKPETAAPAPKPASPPVKAPEPPKAAPPAPKPVVAASNSSNTALKIAAVLAVAATIVAIVLHAKGVF